MSVQETIQQQVTGHPVVLYMKGSPQMPMCGFSATATQILKLCGAGEVLHGNDGAESRGFKERVDGFGLVVAVLEEEPAARLQVIGRARDDGANGSQAVGAAVRERAPGLEAQVAAPEVRIPGGHVRRIGNDHVEGAAAQRLVPGAREEFDALGAEVALRIGARHGERGRARLRGDHARFGTLAGDRHRDRAAARAQIE